MRRDGFKVNKVTKRGKRCAESEVASENIPPRTARGDASTIQPTTKQNTREGGNSQKPNKKNHTTEHEKIFLVRKQNTDAF